MSDLNLDSEEEESLRDHKAGEFRPVLTSERKRELEQMAVDRLLFETKAEG